MKTLSEPIPAESISGRSVLILAFEPGDWEWGGAALVAHEDGGLAFLPLSWLKYHQERWLKYHQERGPA